MVGQLIAKNETGMDATQAQRNETYHSFIAMNGQSSGVLSMRYLTPDLPCYTIIVTVQHIGVICVVVEIFTAVCLMHKEGVDRNRVREETRKIDKEKEETI